MSIYLELKVKFLFGFRVLSIAGFFCLIAEFEPNHAAAQFSNFDSPSLRAKEENKEEGPLPVAGYEKGNLNGFFIQSKDGQFRLQLGAYSQFRYSANFRQNPPDGSGRFVGGFLIPRTRFTWEGKFTDLLAFHFRLNVTGEGDFSVFAAYASLNLGAFRDIERRKLSDWSIRVGRQFIALSREDWMYPHDLLGIDFTGLQFVTGPPNADGVQLSYSGDRHRFWIGISNDSLGGRGPFPREVAILTVSSRQEVQLVGRNWDNWNDTLGRKDRSFGILFGAAGTYSLSSQSETFGEARNSGVLTTDFSFSGGGFQALVYGTFKWAVVDNNFQYLYGVVAQGGYFINKVWQLYAEYERVDPGVQLGDFASYNAFRLGTNVLPFTWTDRYRFGLEGGLLLNPLSRTVVPEDAALGWLAAETGMQYELRTQLTVGF